MSDGQAPVIELEGISRTYFKPDGSILVEALKSVDLVIGRGEYVAIMGASGSGKSTMMNIIGALDPPTAGSCRIEGSDIATLGDEELSIVRGRCIGFVFQAFNLISALTVTENVEVPLFYQSISRSERHQRAVQMLQRVGLGDRLGHRPRELSGGQQQRTAIARAILTHPKILILDDAFASVDTHTEDTILQRLAQVMSNSTTIIISHRVSTVKSADLIVILEDGEIVERGTHLELLAHDSHYAKIHQRQLLVEEIEAMETI